MDQEDQETNLDNLLDQEEEIDKTEEIEEQEEETKEEEEFIMPEKFEGKSAEEIAKSYVELEKMINKKAEEKAKELIKERQIEVPEEEMLDEEIEGTNFLEDENNIDFSLMTPEDFAKWMLQQVDRKAEEKARKVYEETSKIKESVSEEISETQKKYPLLKESPEFRELVLAIIESAAHKGEIVSLEEACSKVNKLIEDKEQVGKEEEIKLKKAKAIIEKGTGASTGGVPETEEEKIKRALLGKGQTTSLGGLGI